MELQLARSHSGNNSLRALPVVYVDANMHIQPLDLIIINAGKKAVCMFAYTLECPRSVEKLHSYIQD